MASPNPIPDTEPRVQPLRDGSCSKGYGAARLSWTGALCSWLPANPIPMKKLQLQSWSKDQLVEEIKKLRKRKKYGLVWENTPEDVAEQCKSELPVIHEVRNKKVVGEGVTNILIEGDNYHALSVLNYTHKGKFDVIYADPPYNTGNQSWRYNNDYVEKDDEYRHSKWLSFIEKRARLAKNLLNNKGIFVLTIDDYEVFTVGLLLDEIFGEANRLGVVVIENNPRGRTTNSFFATSHEYALFYAKNAGKAQIEYRDLTEDQANAFKLEDNVSKYRLLPFRRSGGLSTREERPNSFYPIFYNSKSNKIALENFKGAYKIEPIDATGRERVWRQTRPSFMAAVGRGDIIMRQKKEGFTVLMKDRIKDGRKPKTVWIDPKYDASSHGTVLLQNILKKRKVFDYPKSLHAVVDTLKVLVKKNKDALILDFFAGSGTTGHAVLELNKEDGGDRRFILCTNNENQIAESVCYPRLANVMKGYVNTRGEKVDGLGGNLKYFRTSFVNAEPNDKNKEALTKEATEMLCMREDTFDVVKSTEAMKIFRNRKRYTGIVFDEDAIPSLKKEIANTKAAWSLYIFSLGSETFEEEFDDIKQQITFAPIPEAILRVYRRLFKS